MELLAKQLAADEVATVSAETVRLTLKKQTETVAGQELVYPSHHSLVLAAHGSHFAVVCPAL